MSSRVSFSREFHSILYVINPKFLPPPPALLLLKSVLKTIVTLYRTQSLKLVAGAPHVNDARLIPLVMSYWCSRVEAKFWFYFLSKSSLLTRNKILKQFTWLSVSLLSSKLVLGIESSTREEFLEYFRPRDVDPKLIRARTFLFLSNDVSNSIE